MKTKPIPTGNAATLLKVLIRDLRQACPKVIADKWEPWLKAQAGKAK